MNDTIHVIDTSHNSHASHKSHAFSANDGIDGKNGNHEETNRNRSPASTRFMIPINPIIPSSLLTNDGIHGKNGNHDEDQPSLFWFLISVVQPSLGHAFAQAALFEEFFFQRLHLLI